MSRFSLDTLELVSSTFVTPRRPLPYGDTANREWLWDLMSRHPDALEALGASDGVGLHGSTPAACRMMWRVLVDLRTDTLDGFLWKVRAHTNHKIVAVIDTSTLVRPQALDAIIRFQKGYGGEKSRHPFKLREIVKKTLEAPDPTPWCNVAVKLLDGDFGLPKPKLGEWLAADYHKSCAWGREEQATRNAAALLDALAPLGIRADKPEYKFLAEAARNYWTNRSRAGLVEVLVERGADWKAELARTDTMHSMRVALAEHPVIRKMRLMEVVESHPAPRQDRERPKF